MSLAKDDPLYYWTFNIPCSEALLIAKMTAAFRITNGVTYRPKKKQG